MSGDSNGNGNGRRSWLSKDTYIPIGAAVALLAGFGWLTTQLGDIEKAMAAKEIADEKRAALVAEKLAVRDRETDLALQALRFTVEAQGRDLAEVKKSVQEISHRAEK